MFLRDYFLLLQDKKLSQGNQLAASFLFVSYLVCSSILHSEAILYSETLVNSRTTRCCNLKTVVHITFLLIQVVYQTRRNICLNA
jgi:hypothetical protein